GTSCGNSSGHLFTSDVDVPSRVSRTAWTCSGLLSSTGFPHSGREGDGKVRRGGEPGWPLRVMHSSTAVLFVGSRTRGGGPRGAARRPGRLASAPGPNKDHDVGELKRRP